MNKEFHGTMDYYKEQRDNAGKEKSDREEPTYYKKRKEVRTPNFNTYLGIQPSSLFSEVISRSEMDKVHTIEYSDEPCVLKCEGCGMTSPYLDEVCYWDINGSPIADEYEMERNMHNPDALAYILCNECAEKKFLYEKGVIGC